MKTLFTLVSERLAASPEWRELPEHWIAEAIELLGYANENPGAIEDGHLCTNAQNEETEVQMTARAAVALFNAFREGIRVTARKCGRHGEDLALEFDHLYSRDGSRNWTRSDALEVWRDGDPKFRE